MAISAADLMVTFKADTKNAEAGIQRVNKGITGFAKSAAAVTAGVLGAGAFNAIGRGFQGAGSAALDFGKNMANVNSIAQLSDGAFAKLNDQVLALTSDPRIAQAPATLAAGLYDIYSSGFQGADGLKVLQQSALAATAGVTDTATAARVITANLNAFGLGAGDAQRVSDVLFQTVNDGVITFEQLANNMGNVIPIANSLGLGVEDVGAAYAQMTLKGVPAAQAETQISGLMRSALNPTQALTDAVQAHGFASAASAIEQKGLAGFLDIVNDAAGGNQETMFNLLGTQEAMNAATILGADGAKNYRKELDKMKGASKGAGATNRALEKQTQSASFAIAKMKQQVLTLATVGFGILAPVITKAAGAMSRFLSRDVIPFTNIIGKAVKGGFAFDKMLTKLPQPLRRAAHAVGVMAESIGDMIRGGISKRELTQFFHGFQAFGEELSQGVHVVANFIIDAAVTLGTLLIDGVTAAPGAIFGWVRGKLFGQNTGVSQDPASPMYNMKGKPIDAGVWDVAVALGKLILNGATGVIGDVWGWVKLQILGGATGGGASQDPASPMYGGAGGYQVGLGTVILSAAAALGGELQTAADNLTSWLKGKLSWPADGTFNFGSVTLKGSVAVQDTDGTAAGDKAGKDTVGRFVDSVKNNLQPIHDAGVQIASYLVGGVATGVGLAAGAMTDVAGAVVLGIVTAIKDPQQISKIGVGINDAINGMVDITVWSFTGFGRIVDAFYSGLKSGFDASTPDLSFISDWLFGGGGGASQDPASPMYGGIASSGIFSNIGTTLQSALDTALGAFTPDVGDIGTKITTAIGTAWVDALASFTTRFKPDFGFIGDAINTALDAIPHPTLPSWLTDLSWITDPLEKVTGLLSKVNAQKAGPTPFTGGASGVPPSSATGQGFSPIDYSQIPAAQPPPIPLKFVGDRTSLDTTIRDAVKTANDNLGNKTFTAKLAGDNGLFAQAYTAAFGWGNVFAAQTFEATLSGDNGPMAQSYTAAFGWGDTFAAQDFQATLSADNGPAAIAYTNAFGWGATWAAQVFTASFAIDVSGLYYAQAVAYQVAANIAAVMPHSPAKRGPLSKPINFSFIADAARRDLSGLGNQIEGYLGANGRRGIGARGPRSGGGTQNFFAVKSAEFARLLKQAENGDSFARGLGRELGLSGGF